MFSSSISGFGVLCLGLQFSGLLVNSAAVPAHQEGMLHKRPSIRDDD